MGPGEERVTMVRWGRPKQGLRADEGARQDVANVTVCLDMCDECVMPIININIDVFQYIIIMTIYIHAPHLTAQCAS